MNEIVRHIEFLLVTHDCVVIPGLGAVLAHNMPARHDVGSDMVLPPARTFSFNINLTHNDGLLVSSVARAKSVSFESARSIVLGEVEAMRRSLEYDGSLSLGLAGRLVYDDGTLSFEPSSSAALSYEYMWLPSLQLTAVCDLTKQRAAAAAVRPRRMVDYVTHVARVAASLAVLVVLGFVLSTPIKVENAQYASLGIENFRPAKTETPENESLFQLPGRSTSPIKLCLRSHDDACEIVDTAAHAEYIRQRAAAKNAIKATPVASEVALRFNPSDSYYLIVASLTNQKDADEFIAKSKNHQLGILVKDGRYRIYAATGASSREAQSAAALLAERYPSAWVCRK